MGICCFFPPRILKQILVMGTTLSYLPAAVDFESFLLDVHQEQQGGVVTQNQGFDTFGAYKMIQVKWDRTLKTSDYFCKRCMELQWEVPDVHKKSYPSTWLTLHILCEKKAFNIPGSKNTELP